MIETIILNDTIVGYPGGPGGYPGGNPGYPGGYPPGQPPYGGAAPGIFEKFLFKKDRICNKLYLK